jgi:uncharacterized repeat protein (TIGR03803 family)
MKNTLFLPGIFYSRKLIIAFALLIAFFTVSGQEFLTGAEFWGMTHEGGTAGGGTIFRIKTDGTELSVVRNLNNATGGAPRSSLIRTSDGTIFGLTQEGPAPYAYGGTIFKINADGNNYSVTHEFDEATGGYPVGTLIQGTDGSLFGMTQDGGAFGAGTIFRTNADGSNHTVLHHFDYINGGYPSSSLMQGIDGALYGIAGCIFKINTDGSGYSVIHCFDAAEKFSFQGGLVQGTDGTLYSVTAIGGSNSSGTIYSMNTDGSNYTVLHNFYKPDGHLPYNMLTYSPDGWLYGTTYLGGATGGGSLFKIKSDGSDFTVLHHFDIATGSNTTVNVIVYQNKLFGYTTFGGPTNSGVIFNYDLETNIYHKLAELNSSTGANPMFGQLLLVNGQPESTVSAPTVPASSISFSNVLSTSMTVSFTPGNGMKRLVILKAGSAPTFKPVSNTSYSGNLGNGEVVVSNGSEHTLSVAGLQPYRRYYLTIFEYNDDGVGHFKYLVDNAPLASQQTRMLPNVYLVKPGNATMNQYVNLTLKANLIEGATSYTFEISPNVNFSDSKILTSNGVSHSIDSLQYNTLYYARVKTNLRADYGKVTTFTTRTAESLAYVTSPANNAISVKTTTAIASNPVPYATEYTIQLSETSDFSVVAFEVTGPTRILHFNGLKSNTTYYSRVRVNLSSMFGPVRSFTTQVTMASARVVNAAQEAESMEFFVSAYPNPFREKMTVNVRSDRHANVDISLIDLSGQTVHASHIKTNTAVDVERPFANGVYILKVNAGGFNKLIRVVRIQ